MGEVLSYGLVDKVFVVTGGSRGIGLTITRLLLEQGARVVICGRKEEGLSAATASLNAGERLLAIPAHVAKVEDVDNLMDRTIQEFGRLDGLINNVGMNIVTTVVDVDPSLWQKIIDTNLNGVFLCSRKAGQLMREQKYGKIVNISSLAGIQGEVFQAPYAAAKAGVIGLTQTAAGEYAQQNIRINAVCPGGILTRGMSHYLETVPGAREKVEHTHAMRRLGRPEEIADARARNGLPAASASASAVRIP